MNNATWNNYLALTWDKYLPPIRPFPEELDIIKKYISVFIDENLRKPDVLVLGSTPEFRDILFEYEIMPVVVDFSKDNYEGMSALVRNRGKEVFIKSDWMEMEKCIGQNKFDFILSEAAFNVVSRDLAKKLYEICFGLLKDKGIMLIKEWIRFSNEKIELGKMLAEYRKSINSRGFYSHLCIPLILHFYDYNNEKIVLKEFDYRLKKLYEAAVITSKEWETISIHGYQNVDLQLYIPQISDFLNDMSLGGRLVNMHVIDKPNAQYHPIFVYGRNDL